MNCEDIVKSYLESLREKFTYEPVESGCIIYTPYLDPSNDSISVLVEKIGDNYRISDMNQAFEYLFLHGLEIKDNSGQKQLLNVTLNRLGVSLDVNEIVVEVKREEIPDGIQRLIEAIKSIADLVFTVKPRNYTDFGDEVASWLRENNIMHERKKEYQGISKPITVDFIIPRSMNPAFMYALHAEGKGYASVGANRVIVNLIELERAGHNFYSICVLDDIVDADVWGDNYDTLKTYSNKVLFWDERDELKEVLA
jgi:hypothetical protein